MANLNGIFEEMKMEAKAMIYGKMALVLSEMSAIGKDSKNQQQGFNYRSIDAVYNTLNPLLGKHGIFMTPEVLEKSRDERTNKSGTVLAFTCLRMRYTFWAEDGSSVSCVVEGEGMDSGDKSSNKAMAIAHKYALLQCFCIPTEEQKDPDADYHEIVKGNSYTKEQKQEFDTLLATSDDLGLSAFMGMLPDEVQIGLHNSFEGGAKSSGKLAVRELTTAGLTRWALMVDYIKERIEADDPHGLLQVVEELTPTAKRYLSQRLGEKVSHQLGAMLRSIKTGDVEVTG